MCAPCSTTTASPRARAGAGTRSAARPTKLRGGATSDASIVLVRAAEGLGGSRGVLDGAPRRRCGRAASRGDPGRVAALRHALHLEIVDAGGAQLDVGGHRLVAAATSSSPIRSLDSVHSAAAVTWPRPQIPRTKWRSRPDTQSRTVVARLHEPAAVVVGDTPAASRSGEPAGHVGERRVAAQQPGSEPLAGHGDQSTSSCDLHTSLMRPWTTPRWRRTPLTKAGDSSVERSATSRTASEPQRRRRSAV